MINKNIMKTIIKKLNENNNNLYLNVMKAIFTKDNLLNDSICFFYIMIKDELIKYFVKKLDILLDTNIIRVLYI